MKEKIWNFQHFQLIRRFKLSAPQLQISKISSELAICHKFDEKNDTDTKAIVF